MSLVELILLFFSFAGWTFLLNHATIMDKIGLRPLWQKVQFLKELFHCSACSGFWVGLFFGYSALFALFFVSPLLFYIFTVPFASMSFCFLWDRIVIYIDNCIMKQDQTK